MSRMYPTFEAYLKAEYQGPFSATDILIRYPVMYNGQSVDGLVLIQRKNTPHGLAMPGGMGERMELPDNAIKEAKEETGLEVILDEPRHRPFGVFSKVNNDPRAFISSTVYTGRGVGTIAPQPDEDALHAQAYAIPQVREFLKKPEIWAFQSHRKIVELYVTERYDNK